MQKPNAHLQTCTKTFEGGNMSKLTMCSKGNKQLSHDYIKQTACTPSGHD